MSTTARQTRGDRYAGPVPNPTNAKLNGRRPRTRLAPDDRREHLIRTAVTTFAQEGVAASSVLRITQAAGVSNGTFYHYFANKQELEDAVATLVIDELQHDLRRLQEHAGYAERLAIGAVGAMQRIAANRELGAVMVEYFEHNSFAIHQQAVMLESDIREGGKAGEFPLAEPRALLVAMFVAMFGVGARAILDGADADEIGEIIAAAQLRTVGVPRARAATLAARARRMPPLDGA